MKLGKLPKVTQLEIANWSLNLDDLIPKSVLPAAVNYWKPPQKILMYNLLSNIDLQSQ